MLVHLSVLGCFANPVEAPLPSQGSPLLYRTWSRDYALLPPHPLCKEGDAPPGHLKESEVIKAVKEIPWERLYLAFWHRSLYPGGPVFDDALPGDMAPYVKPDILPVSRNNSILGVTVSCAQCTSSQWPHIVPRLLPQVLLRGRSFLEVGSLDGPRCFWAEESGASEVVCSDYHGWGGLEDANTHGMSWAHSWNASRPSESKSRVYVSDVHQPEHLHAFQLTHCLRRSRVKALRVNVYDLSSGLLKEAVGTSAFDVVYAGGLLYHLKHPVLGLEALSDVTAEILILETEALKPPPGIPDAWHHENIHGDSSQKAALCRWLREGELLGDATNFWSCTPGAYASMLRSTGFQYVHLLPLENKGWRSFPWRDRRVLGAAKTRRGDLRLQRSFGWMTTRL